MKIMIRCYARFRDAFGDEKEVIVPDDATIWDAIVSLAGTGPDAELLIDEEKKIRSYVMIMYHDTRISPVDAVTARLTDGDTIILFPPVSGG